MTGILDFFSHIGSYAGIGMIMLLAGIVLIVVAAFRLSSLRKAERRRTVAEFNQQFVNDTRSAISDVEAGADRRAVARNLGIGQDR